MAYKNASSTRDLLLSMGHWNSVTSAWAPSSAFQFEPRGDRTLGRKFSLQLFTADPFLQCTSKWLGELGHLIWDTHVFPISLKLSRCRVKSIWWAILPWFFWCRLCYEIKGKPIIAGMFQKQTVKVHGTLIFSQSADNTVSDKSSGGCSLNFEYSQAGCLKCKRLGMLGTCTPTRICLFLWQKVWILLCLKILCYRLDLFQCF